MPFCNLSSVSSVTPRGRYSDRVCLFVDQTTGTPLWAANGYQHVQKSSLITDSRLFLNENLLHHFTFCLNNRIRIILKSDALYKSAIQISIETVPQVMSLCISFIYCHSWFAIHFWFLAAYFDFMLWKNGAYNKMMV